MHGMWNLYLHSVNRNYEILLRHTAVWLAAAAPAQNCSKWYSKNEAQNTRRTREKTHTEWLKETEEEEEKKRIKSVREMNWSCVVVYGGGDGAAAYEFLGSYFI